VAPSTRAMSRATDGFSATTTITALHVSRADPPRTRDRV
jgi:hypothetical protein